MMKKYLVSGLLALLAQVTVAQPSPKTTRLITIFLKGLQQDSLAVTRLVDRYLYFEPGNSLSLSGRKKAAVAFILMQQRNSGCHRCEQCQNCAIDLNDPAYRLQAYDLVRQPKRWFSGRLHPDIYAVLKGAMVVQYVRVRKDKIHSFYYLA